MEDTVTERAVSGCVSANGRRIIPTQNAVRSTRVERLEESAAPVARTIASLTAGDALLLRDNAPSIIVRSIPKPDKPSIHLLIGYIHQFGHHPAGPVMSLGCREEHTLAEHYLRLGSPCDLIGPLSVQSYGCHAYSAPVQRHTADDVIEAFCLAAVLLHTDDRHAPIVQQFMDKWHLVNIICCDVSPFS